MKVVGNILRKLMTNDLAKVYSACGKKGKKSLAALPVYKAIESEQITYYSLFRIVYHVQT